MHEEPVTMSDEEASDSEIILVDRSAASVTEPFSSRGHVARDNRQAKFVTEEMKIDEQLKALGMFEEGMSIEQKNELLEVLAASRETAEEEETKRKKAKEWEQQVYFSQGNKIEFHPYEQSPESSSQDVELCCLNNTDNTESPVTGSRAKRENLILSKSNETLATRPARKPYEVLDIEDPETGESQAVTRQNPTTFSTGIFYSHTSESRSRGSVHSEHEKGKSERDQRGHQLSRSAYHPSTSSNSRVAVAHPIVRESITCTSSALCEEDVVEENGAAIETKCELEKNMTTWTPCTSPVAPAIQCERTNLKPSLEFGNVPYFCIRNMRPKEYSKVILKSLDDFHAFLRKVQETSSNCIPWGKPVRVGRHHLDTLDVQEAQYDTRSSRMSRTRSDTDTMKHGVSEDGVYAEENEDCDYDDNSSSSRPNSNKGSEVECNAFARTVRSAFHPTTFLREPLGETNSSRKNVSFDYHSAQSNDIEDESASDVETNNDKFKRTANSWYRKKKRYEEMSQEENCEDNTSRLALWTPFGPYGDGSNDKCSSKKYSMTFLGPSGSSDKSIKKASSSEQTLSSTLPSNVKSDVCIIDDKVSDSDLFVRKDGQRTYASKQSQSSLSLSSETFDRISTCSSQESSGSKSKAVEQPMHSKSSGEGTSLEDRILNRNEIEQRGITRKRKCEVRLEKLSANEIKYLCSGKRFKE